MYGVGDQGGIYMIDTRSAAAMKVNQLTMALSGTSFGVDFNPAADRLRIVSDTGQNLRHNVNAGGVTLLDDPLDYPPATPANAVGPNATGVTGSAYTNNDLDPSTGTTLYALDSNLDQIAIQSPPNDGTLAATGKLGVDAAISVGFDIYSIIRDGTTVGVQALASSLATSGASSFYSINLPTGKATPRGDFSPRNKVIGIANSFKPALKIPDGQACQGLPVMDSVSIGAMFAGARLQHPGSRSNPPDMLSKT